MVIIFFAYIATRADFSLSSTVDGINSTSKKEAILLKKETASGAKSLLEDTSSDYYLGSNFAPVVLIEYASMSCPHCANFHSKVLEPLIKSHINTGKVKYIYRDFPLNAPALQAAVLANCAGEKRYYSFLKVLFKSQENWAFNKDYTSVLKRIANLGGINDEQFDACINNQEIEDAVLEERRVATEVLNVQSTPTIFINGIEYTGRKNYEDVAEHIDSLLFHEK